MRGSLNLDGPVLSETSGRQSLSSPDLTDGFEEKRLLFWRQLKGVVLAFRSEDRDLGTEVQVGDSKRNRGKVNTDSGERNAQSRWGAEVIRKTT